MKAAKALMVASAGVAVAVSVGLMALAIYLALSGSGSACAQRLDVPGNVLGAVLFGAGVLGLIGALADEGCLEWLFLCCSTALTLALLAYAAFALAVSTPSPSTSTGPAGQPVYTVTDFSPWLQGLVAQPDAWVKMWACLVANNSCPALPRPWGGAGDEMAGISHSSSTTSPPLPHHLPCHLPHHSPSHQDPHLHRPCLSRCRLATILG
ncbi:hypothetical protein CLOM_g23586 [Closterium sp. NIES-68]|nr:hypothetical protein CLOM_g23586 [Closterium sp. NIES-68]